MGRPWSSGPIRVTRAGMAGGSRKEGGPRAGKIPALGPRVLTAHLDRDAITPRSLARPAGGRGGLVAGVSAVAGTLLGEDLERLGADADLGLLVGLESGPRGDEVAEDDVLLEADEVVHLAR